MAFETVQMEQSVPAAPSRVIKLAYNTEGHVTEMRETQIDHTALREVDMPYAPFESLREVKANGHTYRIPLLEAMLTNPDAANILRQDIRMVAFTAFNQMPRSFAPFTDF